MINRTRAQVLFCVATVVLLDLTSYPLLGQITGSERCIPCHLKESKQWSEGPHALAMRSLSRTQKRNPRCQICHQDLLFSQSNRPYDLNHGIGCEGCHGTRINHIKILKNVNKSRLRSNKKSKHTTSTKTQINIHEQICLRCHVEPFGQLKPFVYKEALKRLSHGNQNP